ncbi:MAG: nitrilase-related carbon-nitrogen hydrolase [Acidobacteriota bacterium]
MRIALLQMDLAWEDVGENHRRALRLATRAAGEGARLAILPEMFSTGFSMAVERIAQPEGGLSEMFLRDTAASLGIWLLASVPEAGEGRPRNVALLVSPAGAVTRYAKIHPFTFGGEDRHYAHGERVVTAVVEGLRLTPLICYDLRFPEPFRLAAPDTDLYAVIANWPDSRRDHWRALLRARAIENQAYVLGVNRAGEGGGLSYAGDSAAIDPMGAVLAEAGPGEAVLLCEVEAATVTAMRAKFPALQDVRPHSYRR